jgi:hypothetical protein
MFIEFGSTTSYRDQGAVAEQCPHCRRVGPCTVTCRIDDVHIFWVPYIEKTTETTCTCAGCGGRFPVELERYTQFLSPAEAAALALETLVNRTHPALIGQLKWVERRRQFANDAAFQAIAKTTDQLGPGQLRTWLMEGLQQWDQLTGRQRVELTKSASALARVLQFARTISAMAPSSGGCLAGALACLGIWSALMSFRVACGLSGVAGFAGFMAGPLVALGVVHLLRRRRIRQWVVAVFLPEAEKAGIDLDNPQSYCKNYRPPSRIPTTTCASLGRIRKRWLACWPRPELVREDDDRSGASRTAGFAFKLTTPLTRTAAAPDALR